MRIATAHPSSTSPTTSSGRAITSSNEISANSAAPVMVTSGRTSIPGWSMSITNAPMVLWRRLERTGSGEQKSPIGVLRPGAPHLRPGDAPHLAVPDRFRPQRPEVRSGIRFAEQLAPDHVGRRHRRQPPQQLLLGGVGHQSRGHHLRRDEVDELRRLGAAQFLGDRDRVERAQSPSAELGGPADDREVGLVEPALEVDKPLEPLIEAGRGSPDGVAVDERLDLGGELRGRPCSRRHASAPI